MMRTLIAFAIGIAATIAALAVIGEEETAAGDAQVEQPQAQSEDRYAELVEVDGKFQETFVMPGVDFGQFDKVFFWEAQFEYRDVGPAQKTRSTMLSTHKRAKSALSTLVPKRIFGRRPYLSTQCAA